MTLHRPELDTLHEVRLRAQLANRIARFPRQIRSEQFRNRMKLEFIYVLFFVAALLLGRLAAHLLEAFLNALGLTVPGLPHFVDFAPYAFAWWAHWSFQVSWEPELRKFLGVRFRTFRRLDPTTIENALRRGKPIGLHLRAFTDENTFVPKTREEVPQTLQSIERVFFISVSNPQHTRTPGNFSILEVPSKEWKETVFELMQIASIIVVDTNAGFFDWSYDIPLSRIKDLRHMCAEFSRRIGFVEELRQIIAGGFDAKVVAIVPPGFKHWKDSGKITTEIIEEEYKAKLAI
jgi:hypothetical protein